MFCSSCGSQIQDGQKFCPQCGAGVTAQGQANAAPVPPPPAPPQHQSPPQYQAPPPPPQGGQQPGYPPPPAPQAGYQQAPPQPYHNPAGQPQYAPAPGQFEDMGESGGGWIVAGYIFGILGGLIGLAIGGYLWNTKVDTPQGKKLKFNKSTRNHGLIILILSGFMMALGIALQQ